MGDPNRDEHTSGTEAICPTPSTQESLLKTLAATQLELGGLSAKMSFNG